MAEESIDTKFLTSKPVLLNNPGDVVSNIYYSRKSSEVSLVEATYYFGRYITDLSTRNFSSTATFNIPPQALLSETYVQIELPNLVANQSLPRGWSMMLIQSINFTAGSSNIGQIRLSGQTLFQILMSQCETAEKRSFMLRMAGEETFGPTTTPPVGQFLIPLPWSSLQGIAKKKPFDTRLLSSQIQVQIQFYPASSIYGGTGAIPAQMNLCQAVTRQGEMADLQQGLLPKLKADARLNYMYPIIHHTSYPINVSTALGTNQLNFTLQSFIDADLLGIYLGIVRNLDVNPINNNTPNAFRYRDVEDIVITLNGNILYQAPRNVYKLSQMSQTAGAGYYENSIVNAGAAAPFSSFPENDHIIYLDFSQLRCESFEGKFENTFRIANRTVNASLTIPDNGLLATDYIVYATYVYNGMLQVPSSGNPIIYFA